MDWAVSQKVCPTVSYQDSQKSIGHDRTWFGWTIYALSPSLSLYISDVVNLSLWFHFIAKGSNMNIVYNCFYCYFKMAQSSWLCIMWNVSYNIYVSRKCNGSLISVVNSPIHYKLIKVVQNTVLAVREPPKLFKQHSMQALHHWNCLEAYQAFFGNLIWPIKLQSFIHKKSNWSHSLAFQFVPKLWKVHKATWMHN